VTKLTSSGGLSGNFDPTGADLSFPDGLAIDASGNVWVANNGDSNVSELTSSGGCTGSNCSFTTSGAQFNSPYAAAIDSAGDVWVTNNVGDSVSELLAGCTTSSCTGLNFAPGITNDNDNFDNPQGVAIDASGNVWVADTSGNNVGELVGAAHPVLTPLVACLTQATPHAVCIP
jgi:secreted PhoX family phosphatase